LGLHLSVHPGIDPRGIGVFPSTDAASETRLTASDAARFALPRNVGIREQKRWRPSQADTVSHRSAPPVIFIYGIRWHPGTGTWSDARAPDNWLDQSASVRVTARMYEVRTADGRVLFDSVQPLHSCLQSKGYWRKEPGSLSRACGYWKPWRARGEFFRSYARAKDGAAGKGDHARARPKSRSLAMEAFDAMARMSDNMVVLRPGGVGGSGRKRSRSAAGLAGVRSVGRWERCLRRRSIAGAALIECRSIASRMVVMVAGDAQTDWSNWDIEGAKLKPPRRPGRCSIVFKPRFAIASYHVRDAENDQPPLGVISAIWV